MVSGCNGRSLINRIANVQGLVFGTWSRRSWSSSNVLSQMFENRVSCHSSVSIHRRMLLAAMIRSPVQIASAVTFRSLSTIIYAPNPLDAFRDPVDRQTRSTEPVGRSWSVTELRRKSYQDLHKLWYVLYKERNMLLTEQQLSRRRQLMFPQPERLRKVQKSMGAIKHVLGERKREKVAAHLASQMEKSMMDESLTTKEEVVDGEDDKNKK